MSLLSRASARQKLCIDFGSLKHACPKGIYVAPVPEEPQLWTGVLFVRKGPYANAILRYQIEFPDDYPQRPPVVVFQSDLFHPLVTPLTTYTYSTRDAGADTQSAVDEQRLPPGGLSLRHGFPEWFDTIDVQISNGVDASDSASSPDTRDAPSAVNDDHVSTAKQKRCPHVIELLQYMRIVFDTEAVLDTIPLTAAANTGAWHAWRSFRENNASRAACTARPAGDSHDRSLSPRKQPGGARPPGEWNWRGVWEDRVRRSVQNTLAEPLLFGGDNKDVISFQKLEAGTISELSQQLQA